jgi:hypothetical protein
VAVWNWRRIWPTVSDLNEWIWNWQENTNICHIFLVHSCFKRTQVARTFSAKSQQFSARTYYKVSLNLLHLFLSSRISKAKTIDTLDTSINCSLEWNRL